MKSIPTIVIQYVIFSFLLISCDLSISGSDFWDGDIEIDWQTEIIKVEINPDTVEVNERITFTCIIKDSADTTFDFIWYIQPDYADTAHVTSENRFSIIAPDSAGSYTGQVYADNYDHSKVRAVQYFRYEVVEKQN